MKNGYSIQLPLSSLIDLMVLINSKKISTIKVTDTYIIFNENDLVPIKNIKIGIYAYLKGWRYNRDYNTWEYKDNSLSVKFSEINYSTIEVITDKIYNINKVDGEVLDIGGNIGASAIFFAMKGAKRVISIEPLPQIVSVAKKNIDINNLTNKIDVINAALGSYNGVIDIPTDIGVEDSYYFSISNTHRRSSTVKIPIITMKDILGRLSDPYLLKMDCEGCEYDVIPSSYDLIKVFKVIFMEIHGKRSRRKQIIKLLEQDFNCTILHSSAITDMIKCEHK